jgi:hypothetical protein
MEDSDSPPPTIIIEGYSWLQDTEKSEIGGGNGNGPNVSEESAEDGSKKTSHDPNNKAKDEFWLGFVVAIVIVVLVLAAIIVLDIIGTSMSNPPDWMEVYMMDEVLLFGIILFGIPAMILGAFAKGHNRFAQGSLALIIIPLLLIEVFKKGNMGKTSPKEVAIAGLVVLLISVIVWPVLPFLLGIEGYDLLFWFVWAFLVFSLGVIVLIVAGIMKLLHK